MKEKFNPQIGFILGSLEDGCLVSRPTIGDFSIEFEQKDKEWLERLSKAFKEVFNKNSKVRERANRKGIFRLRICSKEIFEQLKLLRTNLTQVVINESEDFQKNFLRGVFDSEGSVSKNRFRITVSSKKDELISLCQLLLNKFEIKTGKVWNMKWGVKVLPLFGKDNLKKFQQLIGFSHSSKMERLQSLLKSD